MRSLAVAATCSTARSNATSLTFDGTLKPLSLRTNWSDASLISSSVAGGSKLKSVLIFLHMVVTSPKWHRNGSPGVEVSLMVGTPWRTGVLSMFPIATGMKWPELLVLLLAAPGVAGKRVQRSQAEVR